jgi:hypothetical protein
MYPLAYPPALWQGHKYSQRKQTDAAIQARHMKTCMSHASLYLLFLLLGCKEDASKP